MPNNAREPDSARQIENLVYAYAERIDAGDLAGVAELFRNGRIQAAPGVCFEGADAVRGLYESATRLYDDGTPRTRHVTTNVTVEVDDDAGTGSARSYYTVFQQTDELPLQPIIAGHYHDTFHVVDGQWAFDTREMFVDLTGDLSHHLLFELR
jgi:3-phenylpropionate/cinnamic acid dioxygenase small subunit